MGLGGIGGGLAGTPEVAAGTLGTGGVGGTVLTIGGALVAAGI